MLGGEPAARQDDGARADLLDHVEAMRAEQDHAALGRKHAQQRTKQQAGVDVEARERLVEHEELGVVQEGRGQEHALAHALRVRGHRAVAAVPEQEEPQQLRHLPVEPRLRHPSKASDQRQVLGGRQVRVEVRLLRHVADPPLVCRGIVRLADAVEQNRSAARLEQADHHVDGRALAGSVRAQVADHLAAADREADVVDREVATVALRQRSNVEHGLRCGRLVAPGWPPSGGR